MQIAGAILAGGQASRLGGRPKALLPVGDARIIDRQVRVLRAAVGHGEVFIVANDVELPKGDDGYHPLCACWSREALPELDRRIAAGHRRIIDALSALRVREIGPGEWARFEHAAGTLLVNVNTPDEYERARQLTQIVSRPVNRS